MLRSTQLISLAVAALLAACRPALDHQTASHSPHHQPAPRPAPVPVAAAPLQFSPLQPASTIPASHQLLPFWSLHASQTAHRSLHVPAHGVRAARLRGAGIALPHISLMRGDGSSFCGGVRFGQIEARLDCLRPGYGLIHSAPRYAPRRSSISSLFGMGTPHLPSVVDHRRTGTDGPVRDQGSVGACTAFALAAVVDQAVARQRKGAAPVSAMHLWARYHTPFLESAASANRGRTVTTESVLPWDFVTSREACSWTKPCSIETCLSKLSGCGQPVDQGWLRRANRQPTARITQISRVLATVDELRQAIAEGHSVLVGLHWDELTSIEGYLHGLVALFDDGPFVVPDYDARSSDTGHAVSLAGYRTQSDGTYFLIHNSYGSSWGAGGYGWIHERTLMKNLVSYGGYVVDAAPI